MQVCSAKRTSQLTHYENKRLAFQTNLQGLRLVLIPFARQALFRIF